MVWPFGAKKQPAESFDYAIGGHTVTLTVQHVAGTKKPAVEDHMHCEIILPAAHQIGEIPYAFLKDECATRLYESLEHEVKFDETRHRFQDSFRSPSAPAKIDTIKQALQGMARDYQFVADFADAAAKHANEAELPWKETLTELTLAGLPVTMHRFDKLSAKVGNMALIIPNRSEGGIALSEIMRGKLSQQFGNVAFLSNGGTAMIRLPLLPEGADDAALKKQADDFEKAVHECATDPTLAQQVQARKTGMQASQEGDRTVLKEQEITRKAGPYITEAKAQLVAYLLQHEGEMISQEHITELSKLMEQGLRDVATRPTQLG